MRKLKPIFPSGTEFVQNPELQLSPDMKEWMLEKMPTHQEMLAFFSSQSHFFQTFQAGCRFSVMFLLLRDPDLQRHWAPSFEIFLFIYRSVFDTDVVVEDQVFDEFFSLYSAEEFNPLIARGRVFSYYKQEVGYSLARTQERLRSFNDSSLASSNISLQDLNAALSHSAVSSISAAVGLSSYAVAAKTAKMLLLMYPGRMMDFLADVLSYQSQDQNLRGYHSADFLRLVFDFDDDLVKVLSLVLSENAQLSSRSIKKSIKNLLKDERLNAMNVNIFRSSAMFATLLSKAPDVRQFGFRSKFGARKIRRSSRRTDAAQSSAVQRMGPRQRSIDNISPQALKHLLVRQKNLNHYIDKHGISLSVTARNVLLATVSGFDKMKAFFNGSAFMGLRLEHCFPFYQPEAILLELLRDPEIRDEWVLSLDQLLEIFQDFIFVDSHFNAEEMGLFTHSSAYSVLLSILSPAQTPSALQRNRGVLRNDYRRHCLRFYGEERQVLDPSHEAPESVPESDAFEDLLNRFLPDKTALDQLLSAYFQGAIEVLMNYQEFYEFQSGFRVYVSKHSSNLYVVDGVVFLDEVGSGLFLQPFHDPSQSAVPISGAIKITYRLNGGDGFQPIRFHCSDPVLKQKLLTWLSTDRLPFEGSISRWYEYAMMQRRNAVATEILSQYILDSDDVLKVLSWLQSSGIDRYASSVTSYLQSTAPCLMTSVLTHLIKTHPDVMAEQKNNTVLSPTILTHLSVALHSVSIHSGVPSELMSSGLSLFDQSKKETLASSSKASISSPRVS